LCIVKNEGQIAPIIALIAFAPLTFWIANQKTARITRDKMAMYEPQKPQLARAITGKGIW
jgi:hypothetical protein